MKILIFNVLLLIVIMYCMVFVWQKEILPSIEQYYKDKQEILCHVHGR